MKIITFYLPQFHEIPENNNWWGKGFTEWVNVKKAKPLFDKHYQPRIPQNNNYYNLLDINTLKWQTKIAKENGVYGFCFYHYWFDGHMLLEKPVELFLKHKEINMNFCLSWANEDWTNAWVNESNKTLISQTYGDKEQWEKHFYYLVEFFKDERYIKIDNKPLMIIYRPELINCINKMLDTWQELAKKHGFKGITFAYQHFNFGFMQKKDDSRFDFQIEYQPGYAMREYDKGSNKIIDILKSIKNKVDIVSQKVIHKCIDMSFFRKKNGLKKYDYDKLWKTILERMPESNKNIPGAFVDWDNTPRKGSRGSVVVGANPRKFKDYLKKQIINAKENYKKDYIFLFAWNEWAEGGYIEPDMKFNDGYLKAIREALDETKENPYKEGF